ncbi:hypothetical protein FACS1894166_07640 [Bacilli bacterium]|nr:hypothetical protein FACS1894166_07640 [Bacilli bacterium]
MPLIIIFVLISAGIIVVLKYTTFGKKTVSVGMSLTSSQYMGYNVKLNQISAMLVSGAIAGVLGMMVYLGRTNSMPMNILAKSLPQDGFNGIAVGLVAMSNPVAIIPVSVFFGMIDSAKGTLQVVCQIDTAISDLMFAIIVYGAAIVAIFYYFVPYR